ncbi:MAG: DUF1189 family protein [Alphaproteobacteria bacterium]|nr:DUF1189 family protein [Alphaproteobacteria bacterium]
MSDPEAPRYGMLHALVLAPLFHRGLYQDVGQRWRGWGFIYLHVLVAVIWLPIAGVYQWRLHRAVEDTWRAGLEDFPALHIYQGRLRTDVEVPYTWNDPESGEPFLLVDTSGTITSLDGRPERMLFTRDTLFIDQGDIPARTYAIKRFPALYVDGDTVLDWLEQARLWFFVIFYPLAFVVSVTWRCCQALVYGGIGLWVARMRGLPLKYGAATRLAAVAITPVMALDLVLTLVGWTPPFWWPICFLLAMGALGYAIAVNAEA